MSHLCRFQLKSRVNIQTVIDYVSLDCKNRNIDLSINETIFRLSQSRIRELLTEYTIHILVCVLQCIVQLMPEDAHKNYFPNLHRQVFPPTHFKTATEICLMSYCDYCILQLRSYLEVVCTCSTCIHRQSKMLILFFLLTCIRYGNTQIIERVFRAKKRNLITVYHRALSR